MATWGGDSASQRKVLHPAFHLLTKTDTTIGGKFLAPFPIGCNILKVPKETSNDFVNMMKTYNFPYMLKQQKMLHWFRTPNLTSDLFFA